MTQLLPNAITNRHLQLPTVHKLPLTFNYSCDTILLLTRN